MDGIMIKESIKFYVTMSPLILSCAKNLSEKAKNASEDVDISCMALASVVMSLNAIDTFLTDYAYHVKPEVYSNKFVKNMSIHAKFRTLFDNEEIEDSFPEVEELRKYRVDIVHAKPHLLRARQLGKITNLDGIVWAVKTSEKFISTLLNCPDAQINSEWTFLHHTLTK
ncbi:MAG: hypothetical protein ACC609_03810 [Methanobacterium formicicum]